MRGPRLAVLAAVVLLFLLLQREPTPGRSPARERHLAPIDGPQTPSKPAAEQALDPPAGAESGAAGQPDPGAAPDPLERGPCALLLSVVSEAGRPVRSEVYLYRLGAPGNQHWTAGDQLQATVMVEEEGVRIEQLPAGRYRAYAMEQRLRSEDPPAFRVEGELTKYALRIPLPRRRRVYLRVYDEQGRMLQEAGRTDRGYGKVRHRIDPPWLQHRMPRGVAGYSKAYAPVVAGEHEGTATGRPARAGERGFDMGLQRDDDRFWRKSTTHRFAFEGRSKVHLILRRDVPRERSYVALSVPLDGLHDLVELPDGRRAVDAGARFRAHCDAVLETADLEPCGWMRLPIQVRVTLDGYDELEFEYRVDRPPPLHTMKPAAKPR